MAFVVDTDILYGNAGDVSITEHDEITEVSFAPEPHGGPECLWFCFRLKQVKPATNQKVRLVLKHSHNMLGGGNPLNMRPVVRYEASDWKRLGVGTVEGLPDGRNLAAWLIDAPETFVDVAYCYPYGRPELETLLSETNGYWQADTIGISQGGRPLIRLSNDYGEIGSDRPGLYLIARQHSGESPGSWVLDGFLRHIASTADKTPLVWTIPLTNIDGVECGDYGKDNFPYDLNRAWGSPPMRHEVLVFQRDIQRWKQRCRPALAIDFHAPGACEKAGIYCFIADQEKYPERHQATSKWASAIGSALVPEYAATPFYRVANYKSRWETPNFSSYCWLSHRIAGITIENPYAMVNDLVLTRERYQEAGERIALCILEELS